MDLYAYRACSVSYDLHPLNRLLRSFRQHVATYIVARMCIPCDSLPHNLGPIRGFPRIYTVKIFQ